MLGPPSDSRSPLSGLLVATVSHAVIIAAVLVSRAARSEQPRPVIIGPELWPSPTPVTAPHVPGSPVVGGPVLPPDLPVVSVAGTPPIDGGTPGGAPSVPLVQSGLPGDGGVWNPDVVDEQPEVLSGPILTYPEL